MEKRKPKAGFMVCTSMNDVKDSFGNSFPVMGMAEIASRKLEEKNIEVIRYKELISGKVETWQDNNYNRAAVVDTRKKSMEAFEKFYQEDVDCVVMFFPSWGWADMYLQGINIVNKPILLWAGDEIIGCSNPVLFGLKGALDSIGDIEFKDVYGTPDKMEIVSEAISYINASMVKQILRRSKFGQWGSKPMGMFSGILDDVLWFRKFGIIAEHLECQTISREALKISDEEGYKVYEDLKKKVKVIPPYEEDMIKKNIKFYIAHKKLIEKHNLDFDGVKCIFELSDNYCSVCVAQSIIQNDGFVSVCETAPKSALTMYILRLITDAPIFHNDVEQIDIDNGIVRLAMTSAAPFEMADERGVEIVEGLDVGEGEIGHYGTKLIGKKGEVTFAQLLRIKDDYYMQIAKGEVIDTDKKYLDKMGLGDMVPFATVKLEGDIKKFRENLRDGFNHICYADVFNKLVDVCKILKIIPILC